MIERIRDKFAASRRKGLWQARFPVGDDVQVRKLSVVRWHLIRNEVIE